MILMTTATMTMMVIITDTLSVLNESIIHTRGIKTFFCLLLFFYIILVSHRTQGEFSVSPAVPVSSHLANFVIAS